MKSKFTWIFTLLLAFFIQFSFAQEKTVTGVVTDEGGLPIPGVNVAVQGSEAAGVQTDFDGNYSIQAAQGQKLVFTYVGMQTQTVTVGASSTIPSVTMEDGVELTEVVVEGYRTTSRPRSNVAVTTISSETIENRPNVSFVQSLQGQIPGLNISTGSGSPGSANTSVILRGIGSLSGNTDPLYMIDGVPSNLLNFRSINPNDIASVSVLKDAGATSVYGNRGANGVIVVTTKRGVYDSKLQIRYSGVTGFTTLQDHDYRIMNSDQLLRLERTKGVGFGAGLTDEQIAAYPNTNWQDVFFRTGVSQNHNLSFVQGSKNTNSFISVGYFEQEGIVPNTDIQRITLRSNFSGKSNDERFNYTTNLYAGYSKRNELEAETRADIAGNVLQNPLQGMLSSLPYLDPNDYQNGQQLFEEFGQPNFGITPFMLMDYIDNITNEYNEIKLLFNGSASYKITDDLMVGVNGGMDFTENQRIFARNPDSYLAIVSAESGNYEFPGYIQESSARDFSFNGNARINYNKTFGDKHSIDASVLTEYYKAHFKSLGYTTTGLNPKNYHPGAGTGFIPFNPAEGQFYQRTASASMQEAGLFSYFAILDYDYDSKYGIGVSGRRDATYRFVGDNQWATFWSVSARWNLDREEFLQNTIFTELKLRGSIGTTGNQALDGASPYSASGITRMLYGTGTGYANQPQMGLTNLANPFVQWETLLQTNIGLDFVLNKRFRGTVDVYQKETIELYQGRPISAINGQSLLEDNVGGMVNKGVEVLLAYDVIQNEDFNLTISGNGSYNQNRLKDQPGEEVFVGDLQVQRNDNVAYQYFAVPYLGVNPVNGNSLFLDIDGNVTENATLGDRRATGKSPIPVYQGGFGFEADYKGFYASAQFTFFADVWRYDYDLGSLQDPLSIGQFPVSTDMDRAWTPDNRVTDIPSINATNTASEDLSDRFLRDASYLRLRFATIGYNVPQRFLDQTFFSNVRIYAQGENFLTWTKWRGFDPESNGASTFGGYPTPRVISFGLDLQF